MCEEPLGVEDIQELVEDYLTDYNNIVGKAYVKIDISGNYA
jgi:hypothetical protein